MEKEHLELISQGLENFHLPRYAEIPNVGLYLEQVSKYVGEYLQSLGEFSLTPSMISNYVKRGLIPNPVKKQYGRDQLAYLLFIAIAKSVLSLDSLDAFIRIQKSGFSLEKAYNFFCMEFENVLRFTFDICDAMEPNVGEESRERRLLETCVVAAVEKIYLEKSLRQITAETLGKGE